MTGWRGICYPRPMTSAALPSLLSRLRLAATRVADLALPPQCFSCHQPVARHGNLCAACWLAIDFIERPFCEVSGLPFAFHPADVASGAPSIRAEVIDNPPPYARARAVMRYNDVSAALVSRFKYADRLEAAPAFARWMARAGADLLTGADLLIPVPLHRRRLFSRRYNQAAELARAIGVESGLAVGSNLLARVRATRPQVGLTGAARRRNVAGAFRLRPGMGGRIEGKAVVLVDDVMTTGATIEACARALLAAGAREVRVLTLARVVHGEPLSI